MGDRAGLSCLPLHGHWHPPQEVIAGSWGQARAEGRQVGIRMAKSVLGLACALTDPSFDSGLVL